MIPTHWKKSKDHHHCTEPAIHHFSNFVLYFSVVDNQYLNRHKYYQMEFIKCFGYIIFSICPSKLEYININVYQCITFRIWGEKTVRLICSCEMICMDANNITTPWL